MWQYQDQLDYPGEEWREIPYKSTTIKVSLYGRIWALDGRKTFGSKKRDGYMVFHDDPIHRFVCRAFKPNPDCENLYVDHIDDNKANNCAGNLDWVTASENQQRARARITFKPTGRRRAVAQYTLTGEFIAQYASMTEASTKTGIPLCTISSCCRNGITHDWPYRWQRLR